MPLPTTEDLHPDAAGLDARPLPEAARILHAGQVAALQSVEAAAGPIATAAERMADALRGGHRLVYVAAGSSGL